MKRILLLLLAPLTACGTDVAGPAPTALSCLYDDAVALASGEVVQAVGRDARSLCVSSDDAEPGTFVYIPFFATGAPADDDETVEVELDISAFALTGAASELGPRESLGLGPSATTGIASRTPQEGVRWDAAFHQRLRERELRELGPRIRPGAPAALPAAARAEPDVPELGELMDLNVAISCTERDMRTGRVQFVSDHAVVMADVENPPGLFWHDYQHVGLTFDTLIYPVETAHFGAPEDIDGNGRSILFFTRAVNELNPRTAKVLTIGFFWSGDLFPEEETDRLQACPASNRGEMFYLIAPDPFGSIGPVFPADRVVETSIPLIAHEYQHLINASRRLFVNDATTFEDAWLNEGLSHAAEELLFYETSGLRPGQNLTLDIIRDTPGGNARRREFMSFNLDNLAKYLARPDTASLMGIDLLSTRGATWSFLRYAADRSGRDDALFFQELVNSRSAGLDNLRGVLQAEPLAWMQDWTVAIFADDLLPDLAPAYRIPSWNYRGMYEEGYPLELRPPKDDEPLRVTLQAGGGAYVPFQLLPEDLGVIHAELDGSEKAEALRGSVIRVR